MNNKEVVNLGLISYEDALAKQQFYAEKVQNEHPYWGYLLLCEHNHVYTLGKHCPLQLYSTMQTPQCIKSQNSSLYTK